MAHWDYLKAQASGHRYLVWCHRQGMPPDITVSNNRDSAISELVTSIVTYGLNNLLHIELLDTIDGVAINVHVGADEVSIASPEETMKIVSSLNPNIRVDVVKLLQRKDAAAFETSNDFALDDEPEKSLITIAMEEYGRHFEVEPMRPADEARLRIMRNERLDNLNVVIRNWSTLRYCEGYRTASTRATADYLMNWVIDEEGKCWSTSWKQEVALGRTESVFGVVFSREGLGRLLLKKSRVPMLEAFETIDLFNDDMNGFLSLFDKLEA